MIDLGLYLGAIVINTETNEVGKIVSTSVKDAAIPCVVVQLIKRADGSKPKVGGNFIWAVAKVKEQ
jgi:hypothetical protein